LFLPLLCFAPLSSWGQDFKKLATDVSAKIHAVGRERVTVVDFVDLDRKPNKLGKFLANQLQSDLAEPELKLVVVDQSQLPQLLEQMEKMDEGLLDQATGQKLGKMLGTEVLIVGTVIPSSAWVRLDIKAIDLQTAKVISGGTTKVTRLTSALVDRLASEASGEEPTVSRSGNQGSSEVQQATGKTNSRPPARSRVDQGVTFDLDSCSLNGEALSCDVTVTSENRDRWVSVGFGSRAWNVAGDEHGPEEVTIANSTSQQNCAAKQILKNVPTHLSLTFPQFGDDASLVERLRLAWGEDKDCWNHQWRSVDFEKIELTAGSGSRAARNNHGSQGGTKGNTKPASLFQRLQDKALDILDKTIDNKTKKLTGNDGSDPKKKPAPPSL
jgi:hypothetical protein